MPKTRHISGEKSRFTWIFQGKFVSKSWLKRCPEVESNHETCERVISTHKLLQPSGCSTGYGAMTMTADSPLGWRA